MERYNLRPVVMAGGVGSRLWPLSRAHYPKQFLMLNSEKSLLQQTLLRLGNIEHGAPLVIGNETHRFLLAEQITALDINDASILLEPVGRNTAPALALAALEALEYEEDPLLLVLAADHYIGDERAFQQAIIKALPLAKANQIVTFGIRPTCPETGFGYIKTGEFFAPSQSYQVAHFVEKPNLALANHYLYEGNYYWNSGIFMLSAHHYLSLLEQYEPSILHAVREAFLLKSNDLGFIRIDKATFSQCPNLSIDVAVMEKTTQAVMLPLDAYWSDVGSWSALWQLSNKDNAQNVIEGDVITHNSQGCYINANSRLVTTLGVKDLVIIETKDATLVANKNEGQQLKAIIDKLQNEEREELIAHREAYRPWGKYELIAAGSRYQVKKLQVKPGQQTALQRHYHRAEHWIVVSGTAKVQRGDETLILGENESVYIPLGMRHSFANPGKLPLEIIEVRTGSYLGEDDIERQGETHAQG